MGRVGFATGLTLAATLTLAGCGKKAPAAAAADNSPVVEVAHVSSPSGEQPITATGALKRVRESNLSFRIPGVITRLTVDEGDAVRAGQVIATVDPTAVDARLRQAAGDLERTRRDLARAEPLVERGAFSRQQVDDARTAAANAKAAYDSAAFDRRWATLTSPVSGVVLSRTAQNGEVVAAGQAVVQVADTNSPLALRAPVPDVAAARLRVGDSAQVRLDAMPGQTLAGRIIRIGQRAETGTGQIEVEVAIAPHPALRSGMIANAILSPRPGPVTVTAGFARVPAEALLEVSGQNGAVYRFDPSGHARRTPVRFGGFDGDDALVSGLEPGAAVITGGAGFITDGQKVRVIDAAKLAQAPTGKGA